MATAKGHMAQNKKNLRSTSKHITVKKGHKEGNENDIEDFHPQQQPIKTNAVYLILKLAEEFDHTLDSSLTKAINHVYTYFIERGFKSALNVLDNKVSTAVKRCIKAMGAKLQLVEPHNHQ
eukprot:8296465-Ditylum_brightwellii.AAC.1